jgi:NDP-sugar pyrophosphorylase family protein
MNGDILTDLDYGELYTDHVHGNHRFTISSHQREHKIDYGVLEPDEHSELRGFHEKPTTRYEVSMGIYMVSDDILAYIPEDRPYGFDDLMKDLLKARQTVNVRRFDGYWLDIGRTDDYAQAIEEFGSMKARFLRD